MSEKIPGRNPPEPVERGPELDWWQRIRLWWGEPPLPAGVNGPPPPGARQEPPPAPPLRPLDRGYRAIARDGEKLTNPKPPCGGTAIEPPSADEQAKLKRRVIALETALGATALRGGDLVVENNALRQDAVNVLVVVSQIGATLEHIPCMHEERCCGVEDDGPATKHYPIQGVRCHRCAAVRLARSVVDG